MNIKNIYRKGAGSVCCGIAAALMALPVLTSCEDFFAQESDDVLYAEENHLTVAEDTIYSVTGILTKLQTLADRTILLGELRGDLVNLTSSAISDLGEIYNFNVSDDNQFNSPSDYYAVINNCNYFIAHVDTALRDNRNEEIFVKEYCAVKSIRAWTYLQLALVYGNVPFYTDPLLSKSQAEAAENAPKAGIETICDYFIKDLQDLPVRYNTEYPGYRSIRSVPSKLLFFPLSIVRGDLYLWLATMKYSNGDINGGVEAYKQAALQYYTYINERNGTFSAYPTEENRYYWRSGEASWRNSQRSGRMFPINESTNANDEIITLIAGDEKIADGHYSQLRNYFISRDENNQRVSIEPSARLKEISAAQSNLVLAENGASFEYAPKGLEDYQDGDLRLSNVYTKSHTIDRITNERVETQDIRKYDESSPNVHIYRRTMVYLRLAEALNGAGYPRMAFQILSGGLSNEAIEQNVLSRYFDYDAVNDTAVVSKEDSLFLAKFDFPNTRYAVADYLDFARNNFATGHNQIGIHQRGCGFTPMDTTYVLPNDTVETNPTLRAQLIKEQQAAVDSLILNESALEFAFEGTRYYDIMRYALRQSDPVTTMNKIVNLKRSKTVALPSRKEWFLNWKNRIGYGL